MYISEDKQSICPILFDPQNRPFRVPGGLSGDFCSRIQASARLDSTPSISSPCSLLQSDHHHCSSHQTASLQTPSTPPASLSHTHPQATTYTCSTDSLYRILPPRLDSISLPPSLRTVVPAEHTPCRSHPLPRLRIRPSQTDLPLSLPWLANRPLASTSRLLLHIRLLRNGVESMHAPPPTAGRRQWLCALCDRATLAPNIPRPLLTMNFCSSSGNISSW
jgi:hypothetical protein